METFTAFEEKEFHQALSKKDYSKLKVYTICTIDCDPTFERGEFDAVLNILNREANDIFEPHRQLSDDEILPKESWTIHYFNELVARFHNNFSKERIPFIKQVGKVVYADSVKEEVTLSELVDAINVNPPQPPVPPKRNLFKILILTLIVLVATILILRKFI